MAYQNSLTHINQSYPTTNPFLQRITKFLACQTNLTHINKSYPSTSPMAPPPVAPRRPKLSRRIAPVTTETPQAGQTSGQLISALLHSG